MLGASQHAVLLEPADPYRSLLADAHRVGAEGSSLDDRVPGLEVEVAHGRERPVDADRARLHASHDPAGARRREIVEEPQGGGRRQLREPLHLLRRAALEIRADEEGPAGAVAQLARERSDRVPRSPETDEAADPPPPPHRRGDPPPPVPRNTQAPAP